MKDGDTISSPGDPILEELLKKKTACTHSHTCNPPDPHDGSHTHTCFHAHTQLFSLASPRHEGNKNSNESSSCLRHKKRPSGNRDAVRKYREKKKAQTAYLEDEVKRLRALNQYLVRKLQNQGALEAKVMRLRCLLVHLRGQIDGELSLPSASQKQCSGVGFNQGECDGQVQCEAEATTVEYCGSSSNSWKKLIFKTSACGEEEEEKQAHPPISFPS